MQIISKSLLFLILTVFYLFNISEIIDINQIIYSEQFGVSDVTGTLDNIKKYILYLNNVEKDMAFFYFSNKGILEIINPIIVFNNLLFDDDYISIYQYSFLCINLINLICIFFLFKFFLKNNYISIILSIIFMFNPEFDLRLYKGHLNLYMYFIPILVVLFFEIIIRQNNNYAFISLIILLIFSMIYSQYYFYFSIIYLLIRKSVNIKFNFNNLNYREYQKYLLFSFIFLILFLLVLKFIIFPTNIFNQINLDESRITLSSYFKYSIKNPIEYFIHIPHEYEYNLIYYVFSKFETFKEIIIQYKESILLYGLNTGEFNHKIGLVIPIIIFIYFKLNKSEIYYDKEILYSSIVIFVITIVPFSIILYIIPYFRVVSRLIIFCDILVFILLGRALLYFLKAYQIKPLYYLLIILIPLSFNIEFFKEKQKTFIYNLNN